MARSEYGSAIIEVVEPGSEAQHAGLRPGDRIESVDGEPMRDLVDFSLLLADDVSHHLRVRRELETFDLTVCCGGNPGVELAEPVFGRIHICNNRCIFCFVDQLPGGLRPSVYVRDDDYRLSFLCGNFVTLTNVSRGDIERIVEERLSPLYVSLHTTDPDLRRTVFGNRRAVSALSVLSELLARGIEIHVQIVLMRGVNDGEALNRTLGDLDDRYPGVASIGVVPVGIGVHAPPRLVRARFDADSAAEVIGQLEVWRRRFGAAGPFAADEFFHLAGLDVPDPGYYYGYPQLENGIGVARVFRSRFDAARTEAPARGRTLVVTSPMGAWALEPLHLREMGVELAVCENSLFGPAITVAGLIPGRDVAGAISGTHCDRALVSDVCLDSSGRFLDGMYLDELYGLAGVEVECVRNDGAALFGALAFS